MDYILAPDGTLVEADAAFIAQRAIDAAQPEPIPMTLGRRQFFQQLAIDGFISKDEAEAAMGGVIPVALDTYIATIPDADAQFATRMLLAGAKDFNRNHPLVEVIGALHNMTSEQIDTFWRAAYAL